MKSYIFCLSIAVLVGLADAQAQSDSEKSEVEVGIRRSEMPESAVTLLSDWLAEARRIRYYRETDGDQVSYEIKLKRKGKAYSVEFYEDGSLMDIEQLIRFRDLPHDVQKSLNRYLSQTYDHYRITRLQKQYSAEDADEDDEEVLEELEEGDEDDLTIRYELVVDIRLGNEVGSYELLFDDEGELLQKRKIVRRSLDNILY